jgi:hypothetical protein
MGAVTFQADDGSIWAVDLDNMYGLIRASIRHALIRRRTRVVEHSESWYLPTTYNLETNWRGFQGELNSTCEQYWDEAWTRMRALPQNLQENLAALLSSGVDDLNWYQTENGRCSQRSTASIDRVVGVWEALYTGARITRDASATFLVVTAGIVMAPVGAAAAAGVGMTGISTGTAMTTLAAGSAMRGAFTYQDTGNVGSAVINAGGTFIVGAVGIGAAGSGLGTAVQMSRAESATLIAIQTGGAMITNGGMALAEGNSVRSAAAAAGVAGLSQLLGGAVGGRIDSMAFFGQAAIGTALDLAGNAAGNAASEAAGPRRGQPRPAVRGAVTYLGLPGSQAEAEVRRCVLAQLRPAPR